MSNVSCLSKALDFLAIAVHELASISERRIERLCNPSLSELPAFLVNEGGLNSGFMIAHCTAASLGWCWWSTASEGATNSCWAEYVCFAAYWLYLCFLLFRIREEKWHLISSVSENKVLCHPSSVDSLSTSAATEDHVSMGGWAARKALRVIEHVEQGEMFLQSTDVVYYFWQSESKMQMNVNPNVKKKDNIIHSLVHLYRLKSFLVFGDLKMTNR